MMIFLIVIVTLITLGFAYTFHPRFGASPKGERLKRMQAAPNYKDGAFLNQHHTPDFGEGHNLWTVSKEFFFGKYPNKKPVKAIPHVVTDIKNLDPNQDVLIWFGHSSYYFQLNGTKFLVDPVFSNNASPVAGTTSAFDGANTYTAADFGDIDYLIISHDHYDHLDYSTFLELRNKVKTVICGLGVGAHLEHWGYPGIQIQEMYWQDSLTLKNDVKITALPARHFSGRTFKRNTTLWCSYMVQTDDYKMYVGGDSGYDTHFAEIGNQFGPIDFALLENGQYNEMWHYIHMLPQETVQAALDVKAKRVFPVHNSKFALAMHPWNEPMDSVGTLATDKLNLVTPKIGEPVYLKDTTQKFTQWWKEIE
ncbi:MAG: MBL fold metallo-hydrolase [Cytophagaceae bacterium]